MMGDLARAAKEVKRVEGILHGLAQVAVQVVRGAEAASLTLPRGRCGMDNFGVDRDLAQRMDGAQYAAGQGPTRQP